MISSFRSGIQKFFENTVDGIVEDINALTEGADASNTVRICSPFRGNSRLTPSYIVHFPHWGFCRKSMDIQPSDATDRHPRIKTISPQYYNVRFSPSERSVGLHVY